MAETNGKDSIETPTPPEDPLLLGQISPDEFAALARLNQQRVSQERRIAQLEIQKYKIMIQVAGVERALQQMMDQIGTRLNIPRDLQWNIFPDNQGNAHARVITPEILAQMMGAVPSEPPQEPPQE